jgi:hypothetical protein
MAIYDYEEFIDCHDIEAEGKCVFLSWILGHSLGNLNKILEIEK